VIIRGKLTTVLDDPNYVNCTVQLNQQMPPSGAETNLQMNTAQIEKDEPLLPGRTGPAGYTGY
jgi:hypothetical protein